VVQQLFGDLALVGRVQILELAARMGHATEVGHAAFKAGFYPPNSSHTNLPF
jgi:hypothetical protein